MYYLFYLCITYLYDTLALITYLHRYQNMLWCNIPSWDRADFSALAYIILRDNPATTEAKINNRCGKKKLLSSAFNLQIFENGISDDSDLWNFRFRSSPDFYNFSRWLNLKNRHVFCLRERDRSKLMPVNIRFFWVKKINLYNVLTWGTSHEILVE